MIPLSPRESEILSRVATGMTNRQIAAALSISPRTVGAHLLTIYGKLGVHTRTAAVYVAGKGAYVGREASE